MNLNINKIAALEDGRNFLIKHGNTYSSITVKRSEEYLASVFFEPTFLIKNCLPVNL